MQMTEQEIKELREWIVKTQLLLEREINFNVQSSSNFSQLDKRCDEHEKQQISFNERLKNIETSRISNVEKSIEQIDHRLWAAVTAICVIFLGGVGAFVIRTPETNNQQSKSISK